MNDNEKNSMNDNSTLHTPHSTLFARTELIFGKEGMERLKNARVAVFGIGGVGGHAAEALVRSGIGSIDLIDSDRVAVSNLNRQIIALHSTIGMYKVDAAEMRFHDINPECKIKKYKTFYLPENAHEFDFTQYDYIIDAIDTVSGKITMIKQAQSAGVPIISSMGAGNKTDPAAFEVADIYKTSVCPLARLIRKLCKENGIKHLKVVYSKEQPVKPVGKEEFLKKHAESGEAKNTGRRDIPGSNAFVPAVAGLIIAGEVIKDIAGV